MEDFPRFPGTKSPRCMLERKPNWLVTGSGRLRFAHLELILPSTQLLVQSLIHCTYLEGMLLPDAPTFITPYVVGIFSRDWETHLMCFPNAFSWGNRWTVLFTCAQHKSICRRLFWVHLVASALAFPPIIPSTCVYNLQLPGSKWQQQQVVACWTVGRVHTPRI